MLCQRIEPGAEKEVNSPLLDSSIHSSIEHSLHARQSTTHWGYRNEESN
jgi:hypothetical protein